MSISNGFVNNTNINQFAGPQSVVTAAVVNTNVVNTNHVQAGDSGPLYPSFSLFGFPGARTTETTGVVNDTNVNQFAGPQSRLTAAVVNTNDVRSSENSFAPFPFFAFPEAGSLGTGSGIRNDSGINQFAGAGSVLTAAVANNNHIDAGSGFLFAPMPQFPFPFARPAQ